ncbi:unnamed protein product [Rotaria sp. Silwood2]|nr:unnamed protein product [Rotaria sp. Silwood2]CAF4195023.1 unnamed protein product [Rotaria sp. Silwood2]CAF4531737.1 unnamed protein product [Rotaria sp. Silwood2]
MFSPQIEWNCSQCRSSVADRRKYCIDCHSMLTWTCISSGKSGLYTNYYRHRNICDYCILELEDEKQQEIEEKRVTIQQQLQEQRPWSDWRRTDESCIQHTGHDVEQIEQLYSMCE